MATMSRLLPIVGWSYGLQTLGAIIFVPQQNEKYYDFFGAAGFLSTTLLSLYYPFLNSGSKLPSLLSFGPRQLLVSFALGLWSARLGSFLLTRALNAGGDSRFDEIKNKPAMFSFFWFGQATWVFAVGLPVFLVNLMPRALHPSLSLIDYAGLALFGGSLLAEIAADQQKSAWRRAKDASEHDEKFISSGLWGISRHPNYVGEVGVWAGMWVLALESLRAGYYPKYVTSMALVSPVLTYLLLAKVSGVPPLEKKSRKEIRR